MAEGHYVFADIRQTARVSGAGAGHVLLDSTVHSLVDVAVKLHNHARGLPATAYAEQSVQPVEGGAALDMGGSIRPTAGAQSRRGGLGGDSKGLEEEVVQRKLSPPVGDTKAGCSRRDLQVAAALYYASQEQGPEHSPVLSSTNAISGAVAIATDTPANSTRLQLLGHAGTSDNNRRRRASAPKPVLHDGRKGQTRPRDHATAQASAAGLSAEQVRRAMYKQQVVVDTFSQRFYADQLLLSQQQRQQQQRLLNEVFAYENFSLHYETPPFFGPDGSYTAVRRGRRKTGPAAPGDEAGTGDVGRIESAFLVFMNPADAPYTKVLAPYIACGHVVFACFLYIYYLCFVAIMTASMPEIVSIRNITFLSGCEHMINILLPFVRVLISIQDSILGPKITENYAHCISLPFYKVKRY